MGSIMDSGYWTCPGCFSCFKWDSDKVDSHELTCRKYKDYIKRLKEFRENKDKNENKQNPRTS